MKGNPLEIHTNPTENQAIPNLKFPRFLKLQKFFKFFKFKKIPKLPKFPKCQGWCIGVGMGFQ